MSTFQNKAIVVPVDSSQQSIDAVKFALELTDGKPKVHIVHVIPDLLHQWPYPALHDSQMDDSQRKRKAEEDLASEIGDAVSRELPIDVKVGDPGNEIVEFAKQIDAGLIVIPSHGRSGLSRMLLGSVAERVVRLSPCPVMVLKPTQVGEPHESTVQDSVPDMRVDDLLEVYSTSDPNYAEILKNGLHAEGIKCEIDGESQGGFAGLNSFPIKLFVRAEDFDRARKHIETHDPK